MEFLRRKRDFPKLDCGTCERLAREEQQTARQEGIGYDIDLPCRECVWENFELMPENAEAVQVYALMSRPIARDFPIAREVASALLDLKLTRGQAARLWNRLDQIDEFVRGQGRPPDEYIQGRPAGRMD